MAEAALELARALIARASVTPDDAGCQALIAERCPELLELFAYSDVFPSAGGGAEAMARSFGVPFFGRVPLDPEIVRACEAGTSYTAGVQSRGARSLLQPIVDKLIEATEGATAAQDAPMEE